VLKDQQPTALLEQAADFGFSPDEIEMITDASGDRVGHEHLRGMIARKEVALGLVEDSSRLTRSPEEFAAVVRSCDDAGTLVCADGTLS
jgi:hypothetical protein